MKALPQAQGVLFWLVPCILFLKWGHGSTYLHCCTVKIQTPPVLDDYSGFFCSHHTRVQVRGHWFRAAALAMQHVPISSAQPTSTPQAPGLRHCSTTTLIYMLQPGFICSGQALGTGAEQCICVCRDGSRGSSIAVHCQHGNN